MSLPDVILDTSWSVQYLPNTSQTSSLLEHLTPWNKADGDGELTSLARECFDYVQSRTDSELTDDLNDERDRTGHLRDCKITRVVTTANTGAQFTNETLGVLLESRYQKTTYQIILLTCSRTKRRSEHSLVAILYKASQSNLHKIKGWLKERFSLPDPRPAEFEAEILARVGSQYFAALSTQGLIADDYGEALRHAVLQQVIGHLKISISFSNLAEGDIAPNLKTIDLDLPSDTVGSLLAKVKRNQDVRSPERLFLDELADLIFQRTGLKLPLSGRRPDSSAHHKASNLDHPTPSGSEETPGPIPVRLSRISCAAFAISSEGKFKLSSKPITSAFAVGYSEDPVVAAHWTLLQLVRETALEVASNLGD